MLWLNKSCLAESLSKLSYGHMSNHSRLTITKAHEAKENLAGSLGNGCTWGNLKRDLAFLTADECKDLKASWWWLRSTPVCGHFPTCFPSFISDISGSDGF